jgi:NADH:ubiquinone oxidoreductase subunit K
MAGIFDSIPLITIILFAIGLVGVMVYERAKTRQDEKTNT